MSFTFAVSWTNENILTPSYGKTQCCNCCVIWYHLVMWLSLILMLMYNIEEVGQRPLCEVPFNRKYWSSLNLEVWPQTEQNKILVEFKFGGGASHSVLHHRKYCTCVYQKALLSSCLRLYLNQTVSSWNNWQRASAELAVCTARVEECQVGQRCYCKHYVIIHCGRK